MQRNCLYCKKKIDETNYFCPFCGKRQLIDEELVNAAKQNDQQAITEIYILSQQNVYFTIRSMVKDEDTIEDLVQDTFIKVFESLDTLSFEADKFQAWVRRIAHNTTINYLKKKKETLFSEMENEDSETEIEFADERTEHLPEEVMDRDETARLVREMLDSLSEEQRLAVGMYYYEQYSVNEIAETMGVSANTVKSRLNYARKKIEEKVKELEKQGTKLYNLSPISFLMLLFKNQDLQATVPDTAAAEKAVGAIMAAKTAVEAVGESIAAQGAANVAGQGMTTGGVTAAAGQGAAGEASATVGQAVATTGKASAAIGKASFSAKIAAGVVAAGIVGGIAYYGLNSQPTEMVSTETETVMEVVMEIETETEPQTEVISTNKDVMMPATTSSKVWRSDISKSEIESITVKIN